MEIFLTRSLSKKAVQGVDYIFHMATAFRHTELSDQSYENVDYLGTKLIAEAAARQTSLKTICSCFDLWRSRTYRKNLLLMKRIPVTQGMFYQRCKAKAEGWIEGYAEKQNLSLSIVRPVAIYGPGDERLLKVFKFAQKSWFPVLNSSEEAWYHLIHVDDLTDFMMTCAVHPKAEGEIFLVREPEANAFERNCE